MISFRMLFKTIFAASLLLACMALQVDAMPPKKKARAETPAETPRLVTPARGRIPGRSATPRRGRPLVRSVAPTTRGVPPERTGSALPQGPAGTPRGEENHEQKKREQEKRPGFWAKIGAKLRNPHLLVALAFLVLSVKLKRKHLLAEVRYALDQCKASRLTWDDFWFGAEGAVLDSPCIACFLYGAYGGLNWLFHKAVIWFHHGVVGD